MEYYLVRRLLRCQRKAPSFGHSLCLRRGLGLCRQGPGHPFNFNHNEKVGHPGNSVCWLRTSSPLSNRDFMTDQFVSFMCPGSAAKACGSSPPIPSSSSSGLAQSTLRSTPAQAGTNGYLPRLSLAPAGMTKQPPQPAPPPAAVEVAAAVVPPPEMETLL